MELRSEGQTEIGNNTPLAPLFQSNLKRKGTIDVWWLYDDGGKQFKTVWLKIVS